MRRVRYGCAGGGRDRSLVVGAGVRRWGGKVGGGAAMGVVVVQSGERWVGKECGSGWAP